jgi:DNA replication and repair protein RecF
LITYNKLLQQRNALLKYFYINRTFDSTALSVYDEQLVDLGSYIHATRTAFLESFTPIFRKYYKQISRSEEVVDIYYKADFNHTDPTQVLKDAQQKDMQLQYTSVGTHKDDLLFLPDDHAVKKFGSQGQQKSFLTALKLAQFEFIKQESGTVPILLLDDIFDKIDDQRVSYLMQLVTNHEFGQIFITDTDPDRVPSIFDSTDVDLKVFEVEEGSVAPVKQEVEK